MTEIERNAKLFKLQNRIAILFARDPVMNKNIIHKLKRQLKTLQNDI